jgi:2',3'-cyclic-nucleotide 2'-phosphodiesterase
MVGPRNSVIGIRKEIVIERFINLMPQKFKVADSDNWISGVLIDIDMESGKALSITRINKKVYD